MQLEYRIKINTGSHKGTEIIIDVPIEELEIDGLPMVLIERGYLECWCNDGEFDVLERKLNN